jgi:type II secretory pathway component GspD/PulD (secretin)
MKSIKARHTPQHPLVGYALALCIAATASWSHASDKLVSLRFAEADIEQTAKVIGEITGRSYVLSPTLVGTISIQTQSPVTSEIVNDLFIAALRREGYEVSEESPGTTRIRSSSGSLKVFGPQI